LAIFPRQARRLARPVLVTGWAFLLRGIVGCGGRPIRPRRGFQQLVAGSVRRTAIPRRDYGAADVHSTKPSA
jgi:hypothetical protein